MTLQISDKVHEELKRLAFIKKEKIHELAEKAILKYLEEMEKPEKRSLI